MNETQEKIITEQVDKLVLKLSIPYLMRKYNMSHKQAKKECEENDARLSKV